MNKSKKLLLMVLGLFKNNLRLKFVSFVLTVFMFIYVGLSNREEKTIKIPIQVDLDDTNLSISSEVPKFLTVILLGTRDVMTNLDYSKLIGRINLKGAKIGSDEVIPIIQGYIPESVQILDMRPDRVVIELDKKLRKYIKIEPEFRNEDKLGGWGYSIKPKVQLISGPRNVINDIAVLRTQPIDIKDVLKSVSETGEIIRVEKSVKLNANISPYVDVNREREFTVTFRSNDGYIKKNIYGSININFINLSEKLILKNATDLKVSDVQINIQRNREKDFTLKDIYFYVDLSEIKEDGGYRANVLYSSKEIVDIIDFKPQTVNVSIEKIINSKDDEAQNEDPKLIEEIVEDSIDELKKNETIEAIEEDKLENKIESKE